MDMQKDDLRYYGILFFIALVLYLPNLGGPVLWDVDEAQFSSSAADSLRTNNWIVPQLSGEVYGEKPILMFWFMMFCYLLFGINEFAARFPSFVFAIASLVLTYKFGSFFFNRKVGFWAAIALSASVMFSIEARAATPDSPLIFFVALSLYLWAHGTFQRCETAEVPLQLRVANRYYPKELWRIVAIYLVMGVGVLMKGPLACVVPTAIIGMFLLIKRLPSLPDLPPPQKFYEKCGRYFYLALRPFFPIHFLKTVWFMRPFTAMLAIAVVALPWYLLVGWKTGWFTPGGYLYNFLYVNNFQRSTEPFDGRSNLLLYNPLYFYPVSILVCFFPWSIFAIPAVWESVKQYRAKTSWNDGLLFLFCWALVWVGCFSVAVTKLPSYIVPMYPAFALLIGIYIYHWLEGKTLVSLHWNKIAMNIGIGVGIAMMIVGSLVVGSLVSFKEIFIPIVLGLILVVGCAYCLISLRTKPPVATLVYFAITAAFFTGFFHIVGADRVSTHHPARAIGAAVRERQAETADTIRVVAYRCSRQSWIFYAGRPFERFGGTTEDLSQLLVEERPEILLLPTSVVGEVVVPPEYVRRQEFRDFNIPKRTPLTMLAR